MKKISWNGKEIEIISNGLHKASNCSNGIFFADGIDNGNFVDIVFESLDKCKNAFDGYGAYKDGEFVCVDIDNLLSKHYRVLEVLY